MRAGLNTFQLESTRVKALPKRGNPIKTKDQYRLGHFFRQWLHCRSPRNKFINRKRPPHYFIEVSQASNPNSQALNLASHTSQASQPSKPQFIALRLQISPLAFQALIQLSQASSQPSQASNWYSHQPS